MKYLFTEIKERRIRKWLAIYISTGITTIGVVHLLSIRYGLPGYIFDFVFFTLLFGILGTAIIAWFHGKEGRQKIKPIEYGLHSILIIGWLIVLFTSINFDEKKKGIGDTKTVAVLPFSNFNETEESEFFADGMTDDVLTQLSKISDLKVISRTSVMKYKNSDMNISEISRELGAGTILEGSVRTYGNKVRIIGQLIDANNDVHIWSETYDRELEDIFDIQSDIAERIAAALQAKLLPKEIEQIERKSTDNFEAYTFYLKGKQHYYNYTKEDNERAIELFKEALKVDSNYALALSGLADAYGQKVTKYWESPEWIDSMLNLSKKAISINPNLAEGYKSLASAYQSKEENELALFNYKKAIELNPNYWSALLNYGQMQMFDGHSDEAIYWITRAVELSPDDIFGNISLSMAYRDLNCYKSAIKWAEKAVSLEPDHNYANIHLGELFMNSGDFKKAEQYFNRSVELDSNSIFGWFLGARIKTIMGDHKKAVEYFDNYMRLTDTAPEYFYAYSLLKTNNTDSAKVILDEEVKDYSEYFKEGKIISVFNYIAFAEIYSVLNDTDNAFEWWRKAIDQGYSDIRRIEIYPYFDDLRSNSEYGKLLTQMSAKIDSFRTVAENNYPDYFECE